MNTDTLRTCHTPCRIQSVVVPVLYSVYVLSDVLVNVLIDVVMPDTEVNVLVGVSANVFAAVMTALRCVTPGPVEAFSC